MTWVYSTIKISDPLFLLTYFLGVPISEKPKSEKVAEVFDLLRKNGIDIIDGRKTSTEKRGIKVSTIKKSNSITIPKYTGVLNFKYISNSN